ncbi:hypothetical protein Tco_1337140 [Tanacetum coccineum]
MGDANPIRTLGDYSRPSHEGYRKTIELPEGNNMVPFRSDTIRLVQNDAHSTDFGKACFYFNFYFVIRLAIGLNVFQQDPSPHGRILLLASLLNSFHREGLQNSAMTSRYSNNIKESVSLKHGLDLALYDNKSWNEPMDFAKPVKAISLPEGVPMNKITSLCEIYSGPYDTQYCMENLEQAFVDYASSRIDKAGGLVSNFMESKDARLSKFEVDFKQQQSEMTNKIDTVLKVITDRITGVLPSDTVKNPKLNVNSTSPVSSTCSYLIVDP